MRAITLVLPVTAAMFLLTSGGVCVAQSPGGIRNFSRPTTSPYLNLLNNRGIGGGVNNFNLNYFQQVRPQQQFRSAITRQQGQLNTQQQQLQRLGSAAPLAPANAAVLSQSPASGLGPTGHPTSFLNLGGYFPGGQ